MTAPTSEQRRRRRREALVAMKKREREGRVAPQRCPNPRCLKDLSDPSVPVEHRPFRALFTLALERRTVDGKYVWQCPYCLHLWGVRDREWS